MRGRRLLCLPDASGIKSFYDSDVKTGNIRDLARNEEFSEIAVIHIFLQFSKIKHSYLWGGGGVLRGKFRDKSRN